ncbi:helix-turn-helix domain-containing protein [Streptosporangium lutulentum]
MTSTSVSRPVGELLRQWRERRRMSQMDLALQADISTRHLSFVETGRSKPSREMILHLAEELELPSASATTSCSPAGSPRSTRRPR